MHKSRISNGIHRKKGAPAIWLDGDVHEEANHWLNFEVIPSSQSVHTWAQAARSLAVWLDWCALIDVDWRFASELDLVDWRDATLEAISPKTGEPYSPNTVSLRMGFVYQFLDYAGAQGWYQGNIGLDSNGIKPSYSISRDALAHTRKGHQSATLRRQRLRPRPRVTDVVRVMSRAEIRALLSTLGPRPSESRCTSRSNGRNWLAAAIPLFTGIRSEELLSLRIHQFQAIVVQPEKDYISHDIIVLGKGNKERSVSFPGWLIMEINKYINSERKEASSKVGQKRESRLLLIGKTHHKAGHPLKKGGLNHIIGRGMTTAGLTRIRHTIDPDTRNETPRVLPKYSVHAFRHSYAVHAYHAHRDAGESDPWKLIQMQLGHSSPKTTIDTYLKYVHFFNEERKDINLLSVLND
jgi:integrase